MNPKVQCHSAHQVRDGVADLRRYVKTARLLIAVSICGVCQASFALTDAELAEKICADAVQSAQLEDETEIKDMMRQCVDQLTPQLEEDSAKQDTLHEPPEQVRDSDE